MESKEVSGYELVDGECHECDRNKLGCGCSVGYEECLDAIGKCWKLKTEPECPSTSN